jgi:hypothetical protein
MSKETAERMKECCKSREQYTCYGCDFYSKCYVLTDKPIKLTIKQINAELKQVNK